MRMTMIMTTNDYLKDARNLIGNQTVDLISKFFGGGIPKKRKEMILADGTKLSVQASSGHYCSPREDNASHYDSVEIGYPSQKIPEIAEYYDRWEGIYTFVPVEVLDEVIKKRGGIVLRCGTEESNTSC